MAWSTSELARIAQTTVNSVRHYHAVGLLAEPERAANGYKRYGVPHLVRLLRIRRLVGLGIGLTQIAALDAGEGEGEGAFDEIRRIDADLGRRIDELRRTRDELALLLAARAPLDVPGGLATLADELSERQRALLSIYGTVFDASTFDAFRQVLLRRDPTDVEFDRLPDDADDDAIEDLVGRMAPVARATNAEFPQLADALASSPLGREAAGATLAHAFMTLYSPAQRRVAMRLDELLRDER